jgi:hypothetical protein
VAKLERFASPADLGVAGARSWPPLVLEAALKGKSPFDGLILFDKENSIQDRLDLAGAIAAVTRFNEGAKKADPGVVPVRKFREIRGGETRRKGNDFRAHARRASNRMAAAIKSWMSGSLR